MIITNRMKFKEYQSFYFISQDTGAIFEEKFIASTRNLHLIAFGNAFHTRQEAKENRQKILDKYKEIKNCYVIK